MSFITNTKGNNAPNILESEVGLVLKTVQVPQSLGKADGVRKVVPAGTIFPADSATATGILFESVDVTDGDKPGSCLVAGRVNSARVSAQSEAKAALEKQGVVFVDVPETTR